MKDKSALTKFAMIQIPLVLKKYGGEMDKGELYEEILREFAEGQVLPWELERLEASGMPAKTNGIAWALAYLAMRKVLEPSAGQPTVSLTKATMRKFGMEQL